LGAQSWFLINLFRVNLTLQIKAREALAAKFAWAMFLEHESTATAARTQLVFVLGCRRNLD
jgi:hypothetical protein